MTLDAIIWIIGVWLPISALICLVGWLVGFNANEDISNWGSGWDSGWDNGWNRGFESGYICGLKKREEGWEELKEKDREEA